MNTSAKGSNGALLALLISGVLMGALDIAILSPALRVIQADFGIDERALSWIISIYVLFSLVGTPIMARLADLRGRRAIFVGDVLLFAAGSLLVVLAGFTKAWWLLLAGRAVQGFGGGGIFPVAVATIGDQVPAEKRGAALGALGAMFGVAFILGPILGGVLIPFGWQWLFLINTPIALTIILAALRLMPRGGGSATGRLDLPGILVLSLFLAGFSLSVNGLETGKGLAALFSLRELALIGGSLLILALTVLVERRSDHPLLPADLFTRPKLRLAYGIAVATGFAEASLAFIPTLALAAHGASGLSPSASSYLLIPLVLAMSVCSPLAGRALDRVGAAPVMLAGSLAMSAGFVGVALLRGNLGLLVAASVLVGAGIAALLGAPIRYLVLAETGEEERTTAQGVANMATSVGLAVGAAAIGAFAASGGGGEAGYARAFLVVACAGLVASALSAVLLLGGGAAKAARGGAR